MGDLFDWNENRQSRGDDPATSKRAARLAQYRAGTHKRIILDHLLGIYPLNANYAEIAQATDLTGWAVTKRCSDLIRDGFIEVALNPDGAEVTRPIRGQSDGRCYMAVEQAQKKSRP